MKKEEKEKRRGVRGRIEKKRKRKEKRRIKSILKG